MNFPLAAAVTLASICTNSAMAQQMGSSIYLDGISGYGTFASGVPIQNSTWEMWILLDEVEGSSEPDLSWMMPVGWWGQYNGGPLTIRKSGTIAPPVAWGNNHPPGVAVSCTSWNESLAFDVSLQPGQWHHIAAVFGPECAPSVDYYFDGAYVGNEPAAANNCPNPHLTSQLGRVLLPPNWCGYFRGRIDELRISTVRRYEQSFVPDRDLDGDPQAWALWKFDEGSASTAASEVNNRTITLSGGYAWRDGVDGDCNANGIGDADDISTGTSVDCNGNGVPDECDLVAGSELDCNGNSIPDSCELIAGTERDCNGNGIPDSCDVAAGTSFDCDGNGVPDECDIASGASDCDGDGVPDACQIAGDPNRDQNFNGILDSCECAIESFCIAAANSSGQPAAMGGSGTASLSANDLTLSVSNAPPFQFGLFFYGANETFTIFGDGALCVSGPLARVLPVIATDGAGSADFPLDLNTNPFTASPNIVAPFETWRFQFWYRDPLGGPSGFNLSDGLAVTFCP